MFNMGNKTKRGGVSTPEFDLEQMMMDVSQAAKLQETAQEKLRLVQTKLREGLSKEDFEKHQVIMMGYTALNKVLMRIQQYKG